MCVSLSFQRSAVITTNLMFIIVERRFPENLRDKLFTKFHRIGEGGELTFEGMGLGLYLTKEIIQKHAVTYGMNPKNGVPTLF